MTLSERALYHQIHPAKLATDIGAEIVSLYFLWLHELAIGLLTHFAPPIVASALLVAFANLEAQRDSRFGRYIARHMTRSVEAARLIGDTTMALGAWFHSPGLFIAGLLAVIFAWGSGPLRSLQA